MSKFNYIVGQDDNGKYIEYPTVPMMVNNATDYMAQVTRSYVDAIDLALLVEMPTDLLESIATQSKRELERRCELKYH